MPVSRTIKGVCCACTMRPRVSTSTSNYSYPPTAGADELKDIVATTRGLKAQLHVDGKPVLSAYAAGGIGFTDSTALASEAESPGTFFVPHFFSGTDERQISRAKPLSRATSWQCERLFLLRRGGCAGHDREVHRSARRGAQTRGKVFMAPVTPYYRGLPAGTNYRAFETNGLSGMATEWEAAIASGVTWVQIETWNDWAESTYVAPSSRSRQSAAQAGLMSITTASAICSRIPRISTRASTTIRWFKSGSKPAITRDRLFYFYRLNPLGRERRLGLGAHDASTPSRAQEPLSSQIHDQCSRRRRPCLW